MGILARGDLVVVTFQFSDLSGSKLRPGLVIGTAPNNDFILCQLTSQCYHDDGIKIDPENDVSGGKLRGTSYIRPLKLFTANKRIIKGVIGSLSEGILKQTVQKIAAAIEEPAG